MAPLNARGRARVPVAWAVPLLLALLLAVQYRGALGVPFINDDFLFLDKTRAASFLALWLPRDLAFHWYRPWSRELHYWTLQRLFGARELPFHLASFALWLGVMGCYFALARRLAGLRAAGIATAGAAVLAAWAVPLLWAAAVQDLWMLLFALLALHALARGAIVWATAATALALLSKETAAVLPLVALGFAVLLERRTVRQALLRIAPLAALTALWALAHPGIGGRLWHRAPAAAVPGLHPPLLAIAARTLLMPLNLDAWPRPELGWVHAVAVGVPAVVLAGGLAALPAMARRREHASAATRAGAAPRLLAFGALWALAGWLPFLLPSLGWHAYYGAFGALGAWLVLGAWLAPRTRAAVALVALLALLRAAQADTPSRDWGSEWYQRRAAEFLRHMKGNLMALHPAFPAHSRLYFVRVPSNVGFLAGDGPSLRVWYGDPTLTAGFYPQYRPRAAADTAGGDYFFRYDSTAGWVEVVKGEAPGASALGANPRWERDHETLGRAFAGAGDWAAAAVEYRRLALAFPDDVDHAFNAGVCAEALGDSAAAAGWYRRAAGLPGADESVRQQALQFARFLRR